jgi:hypothetical protein
VEQELVQVLYALIFEQLFLQALHFSFSELSSISAGQYFEKFCLEGKLFTRKR